MIYHGSLYGQPPVDNATVPLLLVLVALTPSLLDCTTGMSHTVTMGWLERGGVCSVPNFRVTVPKVHCMLSVQEFLDRLLSVPWSCHCPGISLLHRHPSTLLLHSIHSVLSFFFFSHFCSRSLSNWIHRRYIHSLDAFSLSPHMIALQEDVCQKSAVDLRFEDMALMMLSARATVRRRIHPGGSCFALHCFTFCLELHSLCTSLVFKLHIGFLICGFVFTYVLSNW